MGGEQIGQGGRNLRCAKEGRETSEGASPGGALANRKSRSESRGHRSSHGSVSYTHLRAHETRSNL
eukprot:10974751-Lingulodinium_polyedra.AAC.1